MSAFYFFKFCIKFWSLIFFNRKINFRIFIIINFNVELSIQPVLRQAKFSIERTIIIQ